MMRGSSKDLVALALAASLGLVACGETPSGSDGGGGGDGGVGVGGGMGGGGAQLPPGQILPGVVVEGSIANGEPDEYFVVLDYDSTYRIVGDLSIPGFSVEIYSDAARTKRVTTCASLNVCDVDLTAGTYYLRVVPSAFGGGTYSFQILPLIRGGTIDSPFVVPLTVRTAFSVEAGSARFYRFDAPTSGAYDLGLEASGGGTFVHFTLYSDASFAGAPIGACTNQESTDPCRFSGILAGSVYVKVEADLATTFELAPVHTYGEGAVTDEVALSSTPVTSAVDDWSKSYYSFTTTDAGSYVFSLENTALTSASFEAHLGDENAPVVSSCEGLSCALWALEPATTYLILVDGAETASYDISVARGLAEGAPLSPVPVTPDVEIAGQLDPGASSFYQLTAPVSRYYVAKPGFTEPYGVLEIEWSTDGGATTSACTLYYDTVCDLGPILAGTSITYEVRSNLETFALTLGPEPFGEGIPTDRVALTADTDHVGTQGDDHPNHYRFTADGVGGDYELIASGDTQLLVGAPFTCSGNGYTTVCQLLDVAPSTVVDFTTAIYNATPTHAITLRISKSGVALGCEPGNIACYDFESGTPADFTTPQQTFKVSTTAAITGSAGYEGGTKWPSCFSFPAPATARAVSYSVELYSPGESISNYISIKVDGDAAGGVSPSMTAGAQQRRTLGLDVGTAPHTIQFCYYSSTAGTYAYIDDIAVR
jgi:hypothetical protein